MFAIVRTVRLEMLRLEMLVCVDVEMFGARQVPATMFGRRDGHSYLSQFMLSTTSYACPAPLSASQP